MAEVRKNLLLNTVDAMAKSDVVLLEMLPNFCFSFGRAR